MTQDSKQPTSHQSRALASGTLASAGVLVAIGVAIAANLAASQLTARVDLTDNQIYTLNAASAKVVRELAQPVQVKVFISPDMPPPFHTASQTVGDLLDEYQAASAGKLSYQIVNPKDNDEVEETARGYGCEQVGIGQQSENEVSLRAVYKCVALVMGDKTEVIKDLRMSGDPSVDNLEYDITKALLNLTTETSRKVAFVGGFGGPADNPGFADSARPVFEQLYGKLIEPVALDLSAEGATIAPDVSTVLLMNLDSPVSAQAQFELDQHIQRGGSVGWFQSTAGVDEQLTRQLQQQMGGGQNLPTFRRELSHGLNPLFESYGVTHEGGLVLDRKNALALGIVITEQGPVQINHPATFQINAIDRSLPFLSNMPPLALPAVGHLKITDAARANDKIQVFEALKSADSATLRTDLPTTLAHKDIDPVHESERPGSYLLAAALQGDFGSYYERHPLPEGKSEDQLHKGAAKPARLLVIASGDFIQPDPMIGYNESLAGLSQQLLFNAIEWLAQDNALSEIRGKSMPRLIGEVDAQLQQRINYLNILLTPALFALLGYVMLLRRRKRRERLSAPSPKDAL